jgi:hypothetical protein
VVERAVEDAYRVFEDYVARGRRAADQFCPSPTVGGPMRSDPKDIPSMMMRFWTDMAQAWFGSMGRTDDAWDMGGPARSVAPSPPSPRAHVALAVEVTATQPTEVAVDLRSGIDARDLAVLDLCDIADRGKPPLSAISLDNDADGRPRVRITVPRDQPAGVYVGAIVDRERGEGAGTLRVTVRPAA